MYDTILVPTDGSPEGEPAIRYAMEVATEHGAAVLAVHVVNVASYTGLPMESSWNGVADALREEGEAAVERVLELAPERVAVETAVLEGAPGQVIVDQADRSNVDLVIMGTHGRGGLDRLLLGSVAEQVVRRSPVPVLTVPIGSVSD